MVKKIIGAKGFGQDAWDTLLKYFNTKKHIRKITAGAMKCNLSMVRIMERSGMKIEAIKYQQELLNNKPQDLVYYSKYNERI